MSHVSDHWHYNNKRSSPRSPSNNKYYIYVFWPEFPACSGHETKICLAHFNSWIKIISMDLYFMYGILFILKFFNFPIIRMFFWFRVFFVHMLPCVFLVIFNILLCSAMKRAEKIRKTLTTRSVNYFSSWLPDTHSRLPLAGSGTRRGSRRLHRETVGSTNIAKEYSTKASYAIKLSLRITLFLF